MKTAASRLGYSIRTFRKWCSKFGLEILHDPGFKMRYILLKEFEDVADRELTKYTRRKYGCIPEEINARMNVESEIRIAIQDKQNKDGVKSKYQPKYQHEKEYLSRLTARLNKNNNTK